MFKTITRNKGIKVTFITFYDEVPEDCSVCMTYFFSVQIIKYHKKNLDMDFFYCHASIGLRAQGYAIEIVFNKLHSSLFVG